MVKRSRALLTDHDRDVYAGDVDVDNSTRYEKNSRVRKRINEELPRDLELLLENEPALFLDALEVVLETGDQANILSGLRDRRPDLADELVEALQDQS